MKTYLIQQQVKLLVNQYKVFEGSDSPDLLIAFAQQKRFAFREKFTLYNSEAKTQVLLNVQARQVMDFGARYEVKDTEGNLLGVIGKAFGASLLNSTWHIFKPGQEDAPAIIVRERSGAIAIFRRVWELLPVVGELPFFIKYHFDFTDPKTSAVLASLNKTATIKDHYRLDVQDSSDLDWRLFISMGVMLDALQGR